MKKLLLLCVVLSFACFANAETLLFSASSGPTTYATFKRDTLGTDVNGNLLGKLSIDVAALPSNLHVIDIEVQTYVFGDGTEANPDYAFSNQIGPPLYLPLSINTIDQSYSFNPSPGYTVQVEYAWQVIYQDDDNNITTEYLIEDYSY